MNPETTEGKILDAARRVFIIKGMDGARMQEIADEAGINKALLHYYFRTKQQLFDAIFKEVFGSFVPGLITVLNGEGTIMEKIELVIENYDKLLTQNPYLPQFVIREINRDPEQLSKLMIEKGLNFSLIRRNLTNKNGKGDVHIENPRHFLTHLLGMIVFPYIAKPMLQRNFFNNDPVRYQKFLKERKSTITSFVKQAIIQK